MLLLLLIVFPLQVASFLPGNRVALTSRVPPVLVPSRSPIAVRDQSDDGVHQFPSEVLRDQAGTIIWLIPPIASITAFNAYGLTSKIFHETIKFVSSNNWDPVDGGALLNSIVTPAINGPIMTSLSILFGSLSAITISSLSTRQNDISRSLVAEIEELRNLAVMVQSFPKIERGQANAMMYRLMDQVTEDVSLGNISATTIRKRSGDRMLHFLNGLSAKAMTEPETAVSAHILGGCYSSFSKLTSHRANLITALEATFPPLHYVTLAVLGLAICFIYLVETDRDVLLFLAGFELAALWSLLIGILSLLAVVMYDLNEPFKGTYKILNISPGDVGHIMEYITDPLRGEF